MSGRRVALLVVTSAYADPAFRRLRAPGDDATALAKVLRNPEIGDYKVRVLRDKPSHGVRLAVEELFAEADRDDLILLYVSGHGVKDEAGHLHFVTADTRRNRLASTGVPAQFVRECIDRSRARRVVVWLDCCYAGAFPSGMIPKATGTVDVVSQVDARTGRGCAVMTAATAIQFAYESGPGDTVTGAARPSIFTAAIVDGLRTGDADLDDDGQVGTAELYDYVYQRVKATTPDQTPTRNDLVAGELYVATSSRGIRLHPTLRLDFGPALRSRHLAVRLRAVEALHDLATTGHPHAKDALGQLQASPDPDLARAAKFDLNRVPSTQPGPLWRTSSPQRRTGASTVGILALFLTFVIVATTITGSSRMPSSRPTNTSRPSTTAASDACPSSSTVLTWAGSDLQQVAMDVLAKAYGAICPDVQLSHRSTTSDAGKAAFLGGVVDIAGVDEPLSREDHAKAVKRCEGTEVWHIPLGFAQVVIQNTTGYPKLTLTPQLIAKIFSGTIVRWDDPLIAKLNPPRPFIPWGPIPKPESEPITVYYPDGESALTDFFQRYLARWSSEAWTLGTGTTFKGKVGHSLSEQWTNPQFSGHSRGDITFSRRTWPGWDGYFAAIDSGAGAVLPTLDNLNAAVKDLKITGAGNDLVLEPIGGNPHAYPLLQVMYETLCGKGNSTDVAKAVKTFLSFAATAGQPILAENGYVPLPQELQHRVLNTINAIG